jgi:L(+)-tartrate dehydratase alpha subunit
MRARVFICSSLVVDSHFEVGYCNTGGMPMCVNIFCLSSRRATARVHADGRVAFRTDPEWFTHYSRRETADWPPVAAEAAE